ncbi:SLOG family protein [Amycolatopsis sp. NBC_01480]|uniref:SLOG family protein n=1 Tax=Amycolatopsis sp. NBC_01480 TaxID=2903562 RepID=UPI002E28A393|nr:SLOG family protein [Amycolatopsis sp. NBC_01480]
MASIVTHRILITGSRLWDDPAVIRAALADVWAPGRILVSGASPRGADMMCEACWTHWGGRVERHPALWATRGKRAGFLRNKVMVDRGADVCLAFIRNGSAGASHTVDLARQAGIPTRVFRADDKHPAGAEDGLRSRGGDDAR